MNGQERRRLELFSRVRDGGLSVAAVGRLLGLSERQSRRLWHGYRQRGACGLVHGLRGRSGNASKADLRRAALGWYRQQCPGCNAAHGADLLREAGLAVSRTSLWRWLHQERLMARTRRVRAHRRRRERRAYVGELVQMDGSTHHWLGPDQPPCVLWVTIDDASSRVYAHFYATEDTPNALDFVDRYVQRFGLPHAWYVDRDSIYRINDADLRQKCRERRLQWKEVLRPFPRQYRREGSFDAASSSDPSECSSSKRDDSLSHLVQAIPGREGGLRCPLLPDANCIPPSTSKPAAKCDRALEVHLQRELNDA